MCVSLYSLSLLRKHRLVQHTHREDSAASDLIRHFDFALQMYTERLLLYFCVLSLSFVSLSAFSLAALSLFASMMPCRVGSHTRY